MPALHHPHMPGVVYHAAESTVAGWARAGWRLLGDHETDEPAADVTTSQDTSAPTGGDSTEQE